jgi:hypothetical protein
MSEWRCLIGDPPSRDSVILVLDDRCIPCPRVSSPNGNEAYPLVKDTDLLWMPLPNWGALNISEIRHRNLKFRQEQAELQKLKDSFKELPKRESR